MQLEQPWSNTWTLSVFPRPEAPSACAVPVVADATSLPAAKLKCSNAGTSLPPGPQTAFLYVGRSLNATTAAALNKAGGFALLLNPAVGFPVGCEVGGIGAVTGPVGVTASLPWWMGSGFCGSLVYKNSSIFGDTELAGAGFPFAFTEVNEGQAWVLDNATKAESNIVTHARAIPIDGVQAGTSWASLIKDYAMVFEADLPGTSVADVASTRVLVSGLSVLNSTSGLSTDGPGRWAFDTMMSYSLAEAAKPRPRRKQATAKPFCAGPTAFCAAGKETACRAAFGSAAAGLCNADYAIVQPVTLTSSDVASVVTAIKIELRATEASELVPLLYDGASGQPGQLLANGTATPLAPAKDAAWVELPLSAELQPGRFFIGALYSATVSCFTSTAAEGAHLYAPQPYSDGPQPGGKLGWVNSAHNAAVYAVTK